MDHEEDLKDQMMEVAIGYAGSVGTSLWSEVKDDRAKVCPGYGELLLTWLTCTQIDRMDTWLDRLN
jgi:hypothetical protein